MIADIRDEMGEKAAALTDYKEFYRLKPQAFRRIPAEYLKDISAKDYATVKKEKDEARKNLEKQIQDEKKAADKKPAAAGDQKKN